MPAACCQCVCFVNAMSATLIERSCLSSGEPSQPSTDNNIATTTEPDVRPDIHLRGQPAHLPTYLPPYCCSPCLSGKRNRKYFAPRESTTHLRMAERQSNDEFLQDFQGPVCASCSSGFSRIVFSIRCGSDLLCGSARRRSCTSNHLRTGQLRGRCLHSSAELSSGDRCSSAAASSAAASDGSPAVSAFHRTNSVAAAVLSCTCASGRTVERAHRANRG